MPNSKRNPNVRTLEEVEQKLSQAKASGDHFQIKVWSDSLRVLKKKIEEGTYKPEKVFKKFPIPKERNWIDTKNKKD